MDKRKLFLFEDKKIFKVIKFPKKGNTPFIKVKEFDKNYPEQVIDVWKIVPKKYVKLYPVNYDSCIVNTDPETCNKSIGLAGYKCEYSKENKKCISSLKK